MGHPLEHPHQICPRVHLIGRQSCLSLLVANETARIVTPCDHFQANYPEEFLCSVLVLQVYDQDNLSQIREVSPWWPPNLQVPKVCDYFPKVTPCLRVISITWLSDARVCVPEVSDERK